MKQPLLWLAVTLVLVLATWWIRGTDKDLEWIQRYKDAPADTVVVRDTVWIEVPAESGSEVATHQTPTVESLERANQILSMAKDSIQMAVLHLLEPKTFTLKTKSIGELVITFFPVNDSVSWKHDPPPERVVTVTNEITKTVVVESKRPWWEIPVAVVVGGLAVFGLSQIH
jgi:hypothetical protein